MFLYPLEPPQPKGCEMVHFQIKFDQIGKGFWDLVSPKQILAFFHGPLSVVLLGFEVLQILRLK